MQSTYVWLARLNNRDDTLRVDGDTDAANAVRRVGDEVGLAMGREEGLVDLRGGRREKRGLEEEGRSVSSAAIGEEC